MYYRTRVRHKNEVTRDMRRRERRENMKRIGILLIVLGLVLSSPVYALQAKTDVQRTSYTPASGSQQPLTPAAKGAVLMEAQTGEVLFSKEPDTAYSPASVTKIMTLLLTMEALEEGKFALGDTVCVSAYAASMGGSQVFLKEGERIGVEDLIKCAVISSANDAAVALAELVCGSEEAFVECMNRRAIQLGMRNTHFENVTGLDDTTQNHVSSAKDIAVMSRELIRHPMILKYSALWQDSIRDGAFVLTNTNRLVRFYPGCNGLKTGSTSKAGYCVSVTAKRGNLQLIAVIMGAPDRDSRNKDARALLDFGFANFALYEDAQTQLADVYVCGGVSESVSVHNTDFAAVVSKADVQKVEREISIPQVLKAPINHTCAVGKIIYRIGEKTLGQTEIFATEDVGKITYPDVLWRMLCGMCDGFAKTHEKKETRR